MNIGVFACALLAMFNGYLAHFNSCNGKVGVSLFCAATCGWCLKCAIDCITTE